MFRNNIMFHSRYWNFFIRTINAIFDRGRELNNGIETTTKRGKIMFRYSITMSNTKFCVDLLARRPFSVLRTNNSRVLNICTRNFIFRIYICSCEIQIFMFLLYFPGALQFKKKQTNTTLVRRIVHIYIRRIKL